jgi:hypothetical protein
MNRWSGSGSNSCTNSFASDIASKLLAFMIGPGSGIAHFLNDCTPTLAVGNIFWLTLQFASHRVISKVMGKHLPRIHRARIVLFRGEKHAARPAHVHRRCETILEGMEKLAGARSAVRTV